MSYGQAFIPNDWEGEFCCYAVYWPMSPQWLAVLRGALTIPSEGRFWDANTGTITEAQAVIRQTFDNNLHLKEVLMSCGDDVAQALIQGLAKIALSLENSGTRCCDNQGSGGSGQTPEPINETPEGSPFTDPPPSGFDSWEEFFADKCAKSAFLISQLKDDLGEIAVQNIGAVGISTLATILAIAFATPIPFDDVIAVAALLVSIGTTVLATTALSIINDNEEEFICELFSGNSALDSQTRFLDLFATLADAGTTEPVTFATKALISYMLSSDSVNRLYLKDETRAYAEHDCSACEDCLDMPLDEWTTESQIGSTVTVVDDWVRATGEVDSGTGITYAQMQFDFSQPVDISSISFLGRGVGDTDWGIGWLTFQDTSSYPAGYSDAGGGVINDGDPFSEAVGDTSVIRLVLLARANPVAVPGAFDYFEWSDICVLGHLSE